jgi:hypothetical protein
MSFSQENLKPRERFLTPRLIRGLQDTGPQIDPFTLVNKDEKPPKAFRVGSCVVTEPNKSVTFTLLLFWKDDVSTTQKEIGVIVEKVNETWLIDGVKNVGLLNNL